MVSRDITCHKTARFFCTFIPSTLTHEIQLAHTSYVDISDGHMDVNGSRIGLIKAMFNA